MLIPKYLCRPRLTWYRRALRIYQRRSKNQLLLFPPGLPFASCACSPLNTGRLGPAPFICSFAPPPRKGFAIRDPAPPTLKPTGLLDANDMLRVEPCLAASSRSLTAVSCASNLEKMWWSAACSAFTRCYVPVVRCRQLFLTILQ